MIFTPQNYIKKDGVLMLPPYVDAKCHPCLNKEIFKEFWHNFSFGTSSVTFSEADGLSLSIGQAELIPTEEYDYTINCNEMGISINAKNEKTLIHAFMTMLDMIRADIDNGKTVAAIDACRVFERSKIKNRMVHFCIFPETELWELRRFLRLAAALRYTHVIVEFWGMLKYDCMKELSWQGAYTKEEIRPIINEANDLGLEIVPMFNHWGHASASRSIHGKHVVLDQNPLLQPLFTDDGWRWNITRPETRELLGKIRRELIDLCGDGEYFHIGCDEADNFKYTDEAMAKACNHINSIASDLSSLGRRAIAWGDMFIYKHPEYNADNGYYCAADSLESERFMLSKLDKSIVIADWQYLTKHSPIETSLTVKAAGFDCLLCPWDRGEMITCAALDTVKENSLHGFIHTTWHLLSTGMPYVALIALGAYEDIHGRNSGLLAPRVAALLRKVMPANGDYTKSGWSKIQVSSKW